MVGTILAAVSAIISAIGGIKQLSDSSKYASESDPGFAIPPEAYQALALTKLKASLREMPGMDILEGKIGNTVAETMKNLKEVIDNPSSALGALSGLESKKNDLLSNLNLMNKDWWEKNQGELVQQLGAMSAWQNQKSEWGRQKYLYSMQTASALQGAGEQNLLGAANNLAGYFNTKEYWDKMIAAENARNNNPAGATGNGTGLITPTFRKSIGDYGVYNKDFTIPDLTQPSQKGGLAYNLKNILGNPEISTNYGGTDSGGFGVPATDLMPSNNDYWWKQTNQW
jgi:hypothetical protein